MNLANVYVSDWPFIHCLYFIYARKNYATVEINPSRDRAEITLPRRDQKPYPVGLS